MVRTESAPMYPYEIVTRLSDLGQLDYSDQPVFGSTLSDFDPQELKRPFKCLKALTSK